MRNIFAILLILASIGIYYGYTKNAWAEIKSIKVQKAELDQTLEKADQLEEKKQEINAKINSFGQEDKARLNKMIPDNADNVRLIIDIQNIAETSGLILKDIKINDSSEEGQTSNEAAQTAFNQTDGTFDGESNQTYNSVKLSFSVTSTYQNYVDFIKKLEKSLRLVDITSLSIKNTGAPNIYQFDITLKAYWVK